MSGGGGGGKGGGAQTTGYRYMFGIHMGIARGPVNEIIEIKVGDKTAWSGSITGNENIVIDQYNLFGGEGKEGGIQGTLQTMMGRPDQVACTGLAAMLPGPLPGFRRMVTAFFDGIVAMNNPYPKPWKFRIRRTTEGWDTAVFEPDLAQIQYAPPGGAVTIIAMNPAHIIWECFTNREWGRGLNPAMLDYDSFQTAAQTLFDEHFGLCMKWSRRDSIESFVQSVIDHVGAALFTSRRTGLIVLKLIRGDYIVDDLPIYDTTYGILSISENSVASQGVGINQIIVTYHDPITDEDKVVKVENLAAIQGAKGAVNSSKISYTGIPTPALATRIAQRDLKATSLPLRKFSFTMNRIGRDVEPGSVVVIQDRDRGIPKTVVRIGKVDDGGLTKGTITFTGIEDVFALPITSYAATVPNTWETPNFTACLDVHAAFELPYFLVMHNTSQADMQFITADSGYIGTVMARGSQMNVGYKIAVRPTAPTGEDYPVGTSNYCGFVPDWI